MLIESINGSKLFVGLMMIFLNIGSRFITIDLSHTQKEYLTNSILRQVLIFAIAFIGTRDVIISLILTAVFTILVDGLFNEKSPIGILPKSIRPGVNTNLNTSNGPFGFLRVMSGVPESVQNPAFDTREPTIGTT
jgi:hypothetical protein